MGIYVFSRDVLLEILEQPGHRLRQGDHPGGARRRTACNSYIFRGYWADVGTIEAFYDANIQLTQRGAPFNFFHPRWPIYTHPRFLPATRVYDCRVDASIVAEGCYLDQCDDPRLGRRHPHARRPGATITRSVLLGADYYEDETAARRHPARHRPRRRARSRDRRQERAHRRRRAAGQRRRRRDADGDGYYIRNGIIVVPKGARSSGAACRRAVLLERYARARSHAAPRRAASGRSCYAQSASAPPLVTAASSRGRTTL